MNHSTAVPSIVRISGSAKNVSPTGAHATGGTGCDRPCWTRIVRLDGHRARSVRRHVSSLAETPSGRARRGGHCRRRGLGGVAVVRVRRSSISGRRRTTDPVRPGNQQRDARGQRRRRADRSVDADCPRRSDVRDHDRLCRQQHRVLGVRSRVEPTRERRRDPGRGEHVLDRCPSGERRLRRRG